jgi:hypothetical protein
VDDERDPYLVWAPWACAATVAVVYLVSCGLSWKVAIWAGLGWLGGFALSRLRVRLARTS